MPVLSIACAERAAAMRLGGRNLALGVDGFEVFVVEKDRVGVFDVVGGVGFGGVEAPLGDGLLGLGEQACGGGPAGENEEGREQETGEARLR